MSFTLSPSSHLLQGQSSKKPISMFNVCHMALRKTALKNERKGQFFLSSLGQCSHSKTIDSISLHKQVKVSNNFSNPEFGLQIPW